MAYAGRLVRTLVAVLFFASACATPSASSMVTIPSIAWPSDTQVRWYDVEASSAAALRVMLSLKGPIDTTGARHDAFTEWYVTWHPAFPHAEGGCSTGPVVTSVRVRITLPRWNAPWGTPTELLARWRTYLDALAAHELGHREKALEAAADIEAGLPSLDPMPTCAQMELVANQLAHQILERYRQADRDYDELTDHGATQGAVFP